MLVLAGAGSGKTRVLAHKAAYLISNLKVKPWSLLAITFTNKAAKEMRERIEALIGEEVKHVQICTFHAFGLKFLFRNSDLLAKLGFKPNFTVFDRGDSRALVKEIIESMNLDQKEIPPANVLEAISHAKSKWQPGDSGLVLDGVYLEIGLAYQKLLMERNAVDFDDLLIMPLKLMHSDKELREKERQRLSWVLVDEYQDVNQPQYHFLKHIVGDDCSIMVVGDPDQSIYGWRGADMSMILNFERDFARHKPKRILLEQNYRSTQNILSAANNLIKGNSARHEKNLWSAHKGGEKIFVLLAADEYKEADFISGEIERLHMEGYQFGNMAVLYRTNAMSRIYEQKFLDSGIPYRIVKGTAFYERKEVRDVLGFMRLAVNPLDRTAFFRVGNVPSRGLGAKSLEKIYAFMENFGESIAENPIEFWQSLSNCKNLPLTGKTGSAFREFASHIAAIAKNSQNISQIFIYINNVMGYLDVLREEYPDDWESRYENIEELRSLVPQEGDLGQILAEAALFTDNEKTEDGDGQRINMLTLHSAKGLEFPIVFLVGLEEAIFPHFRAIDKPFEMEEERRLCYVGITRAEERLYISGARSRRLFGTTFRNGFSRFIYEIPEELKTTLEQGEESHNVGYGHNRRYRSW